MIGSAAMHLLFDLTLKTTLVLAAAALAARCLRRRSASARYLIWALATVGVLALPLLRGVLPPIWWYGAPSWAAAPDQSAPAASRMSVPPARSTVDAGPAILTPHVAATREPNEQSAAEKTLTPARSLVFPIVETTEAPSSRTATAWTADARLPVGILVAWLTGTLLVALRWAWGAVRVWRLARHATPVQDPRLTQLADGIGADFGLRWTPALLSMHPGTIPMAWGVWRPVVLLPSDADAWSAARRRAVLMHELAHVKRRDGLVQALAQVACALYWFQPLVWLASARLRAERERACDDMVICRGTSRSDYAQHLLDIARSLKASRATGWAALAMARPSQLEGRLIAILDASLRRRPLSTMQTGAAVALVALLVLPLAAIRPAAGAAPGGPDRASVSALRTSEPTDSWLPSTALRLGPNPLAAAAQALLPYLTEPTDAQPRTIVQPAIDPKDVADAVDEKAIEEAVKGALEDLELDGAQARPQRTGTIPPEVADRAVQALIAALEDPDQEVRQQAVDALSAARDPRALPALLAAMKDEDPEVRQRVASALGELKDPTAVPALLGALQDDHSEVRQRAASALGELRRPETVPGLIAALGDEDAEVRQRAASALGDLRDVRSVEPLVSASKDPDGEVRQRAVSALGDLRSPSAVPALIAAMKDEDAEVRQRAASALADHRDANAAPALVAALKDPDNEVRQRAARALGELRHAGAVPALSEALKDADGKVRERAASALGEIRDPKAVEALIAALTDADADVRRSAASSLGELRSAQAVDALTAALKDEDPSVRREALRALQEVGAFRKR